jgi:hypothetical protein
MPKPKRRHRDGTKRPWRLVGWVVVSMIFAASMIFATLIRFDASGASAAADLRFAVLGVAAELHWWSWYFDSSWLRLTPKQIFHQVQLPRSGRQRHAARLRTCGGIFAVIFVVLLLRSLS